MAADDMNLVADFQTQTYSTIFTKTSLLSLPLKVRERIYELVIETTVTRQIRGDKTFRMIRPNNSNQDYFIPRGLNINRLIKAEAEQFFWRNRLLPVQYQRSLQTLPALAETPIGQICRQVTAITHSIAVTFAETSANDSNEKQNADGEVTIIHENYDRSRALFPNLREVVVFVELRVESKDVSNRDVFEDKEWAVQKFARLLKAAFQGIPTVFLAIEGSDCELVMRKIRGIKGGRRDYVTSIMSVPRPEIDFLNRVKACMNEDPLAGFPQCGVCHWKSLG